MGFVERLLSEKAFGDEAKKGVRGQVAVFLGFLAVVPAGALGLGLSGIFEEIDERAPLIFILKVAGIGVGGLLVWIGLAKALLWRLWWFLPVVVLSVGWVVWYLLWYFGVIGG